MGTQSRDFLTKIRPARSPLWAIVQCNDDEPLDTDGSVREQVFPGTIIRASANEIYPDTNADRAELYSGPVLMTILSGVDTAPHLPVFVTPRKGGMYVGILTSEFLTDRSGSGSGLVLGRTRFIGVEYVAASSTPTSVFGQSVVPNAVFSITSNDTWVDASGTLPGITLPGSGTFRISGKIVINGTVVFSTGNARTFLAASVIDGATSGLVPGSTLIAYPTTQWTQETVTLGFDVLYTVNTSRTIKWHGYRSSTNVTSWTGSTLGSLSSIGGLETVLSYEQVG